MVKIRVVVFWVMTMCGLSRWLSMFQKNLSLPSSEYLFTSALKMEVMGSFKMLITIYMTALCHNPKHHNPTRTTYINTE
jgi:hypothetical protein